MPNPGLSLEEALFLSHLPYRRAVFHCGAWKQTNGPGSQEWNAFLKTFFLPKELAQARRQASLTGELSSLSIASYACPIEFLSFWDEAYPAQLAAIYDPPPILFSWGSKWTSYEKYLALVGTRAAHPLCKAATQAFIKEQKKMFLAGERNKGEAMGKLCIVSGLALGVDRLAHMSAIEQGLPGIAVLGSGLNKASPIRNLDLIRSSFKKGAPFTLLTEFPPHTPACPMHFPRRNRIIAGLVEAVCVIQAPRKSGALITARYAMEEGRDVLVFDHPLFHKQAGSNEGGQRLLSSGAQAVKLPCLHQRIKSAPSPSYKSTPQQLEFWRSQLQGAQYLGSSHYLLAEDETDPQEEKDLDSKA